MVGQNQCPFCHTREMPYSDELWSGKVKCYKCNRLVEKKRCPICGEFDYFTTDKDGSQGCWSCGHIFGSEIHYNNEYIKYKQGKQPFQQSNQQVIQQNTYLHIPSSQSSPSKVIIREKIKIQCSYCKSIYDATLDRCPNCGARR